MRRNEGPIHVPSLLRASALTDVRHSMGGAPPSVSDCSKLGVDLFSQYRLPPSALPRRFPAPPQVAAQERELAGREVL